MSDQPSSEKHKPSPIVYVVLIAGTCCFFIGACELATKDGTVSRKNQPPEHVTGDAAVREGTYKMFFAVILIGICIHHIVKDSSGSSSDTTHSSSTKTKNKDREFDGQRNHRK